MPILPGNHVLYQLAMSCYFISFMASNLLILRFVLALASVFLILWTILILDISVDTLCWNLMFFILNFSHGMYLLYQLRPVKFKNQDYEAVYENIFAYPHTPMTRRDFLEMSNLGFIRDLKRGSMFVDAGNRSHNLTILVQGHIEAINVGNVNRQEIILNGVRSMEFIDSPQWMNRSRDPDQVFGVSLRATEDCRFVMWPVESLEELIKKKPMFKYYIDSVVGVDVAQKLFEVDDRIKDCPADQVPGLSRASSCSKLDHTPSGNCAAHVPVAVPTGPEHV